MYLHTNLLRDNFDSDSIDELFDAGYLQFTVGDDGLHLEMTEAGLEVFLKANKKPEISETRVHDPSFVRFKAAFLRYLCIAGYLIILICFIIIQYKKG